MEEHGLEARPERMLLHLLWAMRFEWIACATAIYVTLTAETFEQGIIAALLGALTWALQFVRPASKEPA